MHDRNGQFNKIEKYTKFLEHVVESNKDMADDAGGTSGIDHLRGRFINLKNEN